MKEQANKVLRRNHSLSLVGEGPRSTAAVLLIRLVPSASTFKGGQFVDAPLADARFCKLVLDPMGLLTETANDTGLEIKRQPRADSNLLRSRAAQGGLKTFPVICYHREIDLGSTSPEPHIFPGLHLLSLAHIRRWTAPRSRKLE